MVGLRCLCLESFKQWCEAGKGCKQLLSFKLSQARSLWMFDISPACHHLCFRPGGSMEWRQLVE